MLFRDKQCAIVNFMSKKILCGNFAINRHTFLIYEQVDMKQKLTKD